MLWKPCLFSLQCFEPVARRGSKIHRHVSIVEHVELPGGHLAPFAQPTFFESRPSEKNRSTTGLAKLWIATGSNSYRTRPQPLCGYAVPPAYPPEFPMPVSTESRTVTGDSPVGKGKSRIRAGKIGQAARER